MQTFYGGSLDRWLTTSRPLASRNDALPVPSRTEPSRQDSGRSPPRPFGRLPSSTRAIAFLFPALALARRKLTPTKALPALTTRLVTDCLPLRDRVHSAFSLLTSAAAPYRRRSCG
ncbi:hypothetical protein FKP32DRAFT_876428 [Trametes sanguinea]|nr:hypothetical protein FKP32DRAFT_876428 [Trametes sanguinea]